jgi:hypothetical protein
MFAIAASGAPATAAFLSPFADDGAGRSVLEFYPSTVVGFSAQGRDLVSVTVKEIPPENDPQGPTDLALIVDCRLRQLTGSRISTVVKDGMPPTAVAGFKTSDLRPPNKGKYERFVVALCDGELLVEAFCRRDAAGAVFRKRERKDNRQISGGIGAPL